jgi:hypothetical protein
MSCRNPKEVVSMKTSIVVTAVASIVLLLLAGCGVDKKDWEKARRANTIVAYEEFLQKHPKSDFSKEARTRLEKLYRPLDWEKVKTANTIIAYEEFLRKHPESEYTEEARSILNDMYLPRDWERAKSTNTIEAYEEFLQKHPKGKWTDEARSLLKPLYCQRNYERLTAEERSLPIPRKGSHTLEEVLDMLEERARLAVKFKKALEDEKITKEQYEKLMKENQKHGLGYR